MREILFRGKRIDNGEWVEGFYFETPLTDEATGSKPEDGWFFLTGRKRHCISLNNCVYEVDPSSVCQFTGLTDKNGKKIFEGDIIRVTFESDCLAGCEPECWSEMFEVFYDNEHHAWFTKINDEIGEWLYEYDGECEVISNIHDNPELGGDT